MANRITNGNSSLVFTYGLDYQRKKSVTSIEGTATTRYYSGAYEKIVTQSATKELHYITAYRRIVAIAQKSGGTTTMYYVQTDHLGSVNCITNSNDAIVQETSFTACSVKHGFCEARTKTDVELIPPEARRREGRRRDPATWEVLESTPANLITSRGFTGHEHIDEFNLINMNARIYDPILCRFMSPDPIIANPGFTQDYNRYSYVLNNPLMYTDPSGYLKYNMPQYPDYIAEGFSSRHFDGSALCDFSDPWVEKYLKAVDHYDWETGEYVLNDGTRTKAGDISQEQICDGYRIQNSRISYVNSQFYQSVNAFINNFGTAFLAIFGESKNEMSYLILAANGGIHSGDHLLAKLYWHYQFGRVKDYNIDASTMDFSGTSQSELELIGMKVGDSRGVNLFKSGINSYSLALGKLTLTYQGNNQFSITSNRFDFDYQPNASFGRNAGTFFGGALFGQVYTLPITPFSTLRNVSRVGGSFMINFYGTVTIPK